MPDETAEPTILEDATSPVLSEDDVQLLTEARTANWKLQHYEFAYDYTVRKLTHYQTVLDFTGVMIAVLFIYLQTAVPDTQTQFQSVLSLIGTGLSLLIILASIWGAMNQWKAKVAKMQQLSTASKELQKTYEKIVAARPVDHVKIRKWLIEILDFDEKRKEPLATLPTLAMQLGFQHIGNLHMGRGVVCNVCRKEWVPESNKRAKWTCVPFFGCTKCGV